MCGIANPFEGIADKDFSLVNQVKGCVPKLDIKKKKKAIATVSHYLKAVNIQPPRGQRSNRRF